MIAAIMITAEAAAPLELAYSRLNSGNYVAGSCSDGRKLGGALGSGGLAGINVLGGLMSLEEAGISSVIDFWSGDSIGGDNAAIRAAGLIREASEAHYTLRKRRFIEPWRAIRIGGRAVDMDILEQVIRDAELDTERIVNSPVPINIGVTCLKPFSRLTVDLTRVEPDDVIPWLMRGTHLPIASGAAPRDKHGIPYADAGLSSLGPVHRAVQNGCTDVIYLSCQPYAPDKKQAWQVGLVGAWAMRHDKDALSKYNQVVNEQIESRKNFREGPFQYNSADVVGFYPPKPANEKDALPTLYTTDPGRLRYGFERTAEYMKNWLDALMPDIRPAAA